MRERLSEEAMAMRAVKELESGDYCNLGVGLPQSCALYVPEGVRFESENGVIGYGPLVTEEDWHKADRGQVDAGGRFFTEAPGMSYFDLLTSFAIIRSGRVYSVLGGLQVSEKGDLANHSLGGGDIYIMIGGSMDLAWGAKRVIVLMTHTTKDGRPKIVNKLTLPLTSKECVDLIVTDLSVIEVTNQGLLLREIAPCWTAEEVQALTEPRLILSKDLKEIEL
jgi:3-oxoacid CoA-transferase subunit B